MIEPLQQNGLNGRVLRLSAPDGKARRLLLLYGHHSSLERWDGLAKAFNEFGEVTLPDLPGFGGMDSFYRVGKKPTVDNFADYVADFIKRTYPEDKVTIIGMSFGFAVATRMLQRHPEMVINIDKLVSLVGFTRIEDFHMKPRTRLMMLAMGSIFSLPLLSDLWRAICLNRLALWFTYMKSGHAKFKGLTEDQKRSMLEIEIVLWRVNDLRTHMYTIAEGIRLDNTKCKVPLPVWHMGVKGDHLVNNDSVEQNMKQIFSDYQATLIEQDKHAPTIMSEAEARAMFVNSWIQDILK